MQRSLGLHGIKPRLRNSGDCYYRLICLLTTQGPPGFGVGECEIVPMIFSVLFLSSPPNFPTQSLTRLTCLLLTPCQLVRNALRAQLNLIASRCGREIQISRGLLGIGARMGREWPQNLLLLAHVLFQLQRNSLLGPSPAQDSDERLIRVNTLLSASSGAAVKMILPRLHAFAESGPDLKELPAAAFESSSDDPQGNPPQGTLLLDSGCSVLVFTPKPLPHATLGELRKWVVTNASSTSVVPEIRFCPNRDDLSSRVLLSRENSGGRQILSSEEETFEEWCKDAGVVTRPPKSSSP